MIDHFVIMKRSRTCIAVVLFLIWNIITYIFLSSKQPNKANEERKSVIDSQLNELLVRLKVQSGETEILLKTLEDAKEEVNGIKKHDDVKRIIILTKTVSSTTTSSPPPPSIRLPVLVMSCNRPTVSRNIDQLINYRSSADLFPIIVSQDCGHVTTSDVIKSYGDKITHIEHPDLSDIELPKKELKFKGYYMIARHYKWALNQVFHHFNYSAVIIVEDDLDISPDFFEYFSATYRILSSDSSLWCVSAWNDNGKTDMISNESELLYRTDFFPGLGWMLEKKTWLEMENDWPITFWDDWMRHPDQRKDRACIRPEISRTSTFGKIGVSKGQYFDKHLKFIEHSTKFVPFTKMDLSYLLRENYDEPFIRTVYGTPLLTVSQLLSGSESSLKTVRVQYRDKESFKSQAKLMGIMDDLKSGVPRCGYRGIVSFMFRDRRVYFAPPNDWTGYDQSWN